MTFTRVQMGDMPEETFAPQARESARVVGGAVSITHGREAVESGPIARHIASQEGQAGALVMSTLRRGATDSVELVPGQPSSRTALAVAEREGLIRRNEAGEYEDVQRLQGEPAVAQVAEVEPEEQGDPGAAVFDAEDDALWAEDITPLPQSAYDSAVSSAIAVVAHGMGNPEQTAKGLAAAAGLEPALATEYVEQGLALYQRTADRALAPLGLTGDRLAAFYEAARQQPAQLQDAIQRLVYQRDPSGFVQLGMTYRRSNPGDLSAFKAAGLETAIDPTDGGVLVRREGGAWVRADDLK